MKMNASSVSCKGGLYTHRALYDLHLLFCSLTKYLICRQRFTAFRQPAEVKTEDLNGEEKSFFAIVVAARLVRVFQKLLMC